MPQSWNAQQYIHHGSFVAEHGTTALRMLCAQKGEHILDVGCGDGTLTKEIEKLGADVLGIDSSPSMVEHAQKRGLAARIGRGEELSFDHEFDAVFSNAALHWMKDSEAVLRGVCKALKRGGRFVAELGGQGNLDVLIGAMSRVFDAHPDFGEFVNPWYFPNVEEFSEKLTSHGFSIDTIEHLPRPTPLQSGVKEWLKLFSRSIVHKLNEEQVHCFLSEVEALVRPHLYRDQQWVADYVRLRFSARKAKH